MILNNISNNQKENKFKYNKNRLLIYALILALFSISMIFVFRVETVADMDYNILLKTGINLEMLKMANVGLFILLPLIIYFSAIHILKANEFHAFVASLIFTITGLNIESIFSISPLLAFVFGKEYEFSFAFKAIGALLPLGVIAILEYKKEVISTILAILGIILIPFAPGISAILLGLAAAKGANILETASYNSRALVVAVFIFIFQCTFTEDITTSFASALFISIISYFVISIHNITVNDISAFFILLISFTMIIALYSLINAQTNTLSANEIDAFNAAKIHEGSFGVFDYPNAFKYYSGKNASVLNTSTLLKKNGHLPDYIIYSLRSLDNAYKNKPIIFTYIMIIKEKNEQEIAIFANDFYIIGMRTISSELAIEDAQLFDKRTGEMTIIPFTKITMLFKTSFSDKQNRLINVQEFESSTLFSVFFKTKTLFVQNGTVIAKVQQ